MADDVTGELELHPVVLIKQGEEVVKFGLCNANDLGSSFFTKFLEFELGNSAKGFDAGVRGNG